MADEVAIDGSVSLREAINAINAGANVSDTQSSGTFGTNDTINFNIPGTGPFQINIGSTGLGALPQLLKPVLIDGTSQAGTPIIVLNGLNAGANANGLDMNLAPNGPFASGATIRGLAIDDFSANGILIEAHTSSSLQTFNSITGNFIGVDPTGTIARGSLGNGIFIDGIDSDNLGAAASNNLISDNVISGNFGDGVLIQANSNGVAAGNIVTGNFIGTNAAGTAPIPNGVLGNASQTGNSGVEVIGASGNTIGGPNPAALSASGLAGNLISGNASDGVLVSGTLTDPASANIVEGNYVGVTASGNAGLGNALYGVEVSGSNGNSIGGNVIGANSDGIEADNGAQNNLVQGNFIGVGADGRTAVGNKAHGVVLRSDDSASPPLGPGQANEPGVQNNLIGGVGSGNGNTIAFNGNTGIAVFGNPVASNGDQNSGNTVEGNSIYRNGRSPAIPPLTTVFVGIDLSNSFPYPADDGFTANDSKGHGAANDPNNFQNFPILTSVTLVGGVTIHGSLTAANEPNTTFRIEFFASNPDPLHLPAEGQFFLGFTNVTTNSSGTATINATLPVHVKPGQVVTATATSITADPSAPSGQPQSGNTSEFSPAVAITGDLDAFFVSKVYQDLLHRTVDSAGLSLWTGMLDQGTAPFSVALAIENSAEYRIDLVQGAYHLLLHRNADSGGLASFFNLLSGGAAVEQMDIEIASSGEYFMNRGGSNFTAYVNAVYQDAFGTPNRVAMDPGAANFVNELSNGSLSRVQFCTIIFTSQEYRSDFVQNDYGMFLNRTGGKSEIDSWVNLFNQGKTDQFVNAAILGSGESFGKPLGPQPLGLGSAASVLPGLGGPTFSNVPLNGPANVTNLYVFRSPADPQPPNPDAANFGNTDIVVTVSPFAGVLTPLYFNPGMLIDVNVVNVQGHLNPDFTFGITFGVPVSNAPNPGFSQVVTVDLIQGASTTLIAQYTYSSTQTIPPAAFPNNVTFPGDAIATGKFMAGVFDDPAYLDAIGFSQFAATGLNPSNPASPFPRPNPINAALPALTEAKNTFHNANTLALIFEVPTTKLTTANPPLLGVWATSAINGTQVDRAGRPLIDDLLIPPLPRNDLSRGDLRTVFNQASPATDVFRADMIAVLTSAKFIYQLSPSQAANLVDNVFGSTILGPNTGLLPDMLTVDLSKQYLDPSNGFPNGRRLRDDVMSTLLSLLTNGKISSDNVGDDNGTIITDGLDGTSAIFPYIGRPNNPASGPNP
jgi:parallel beta-helix repeat protein